MRRVPLLRCGRIMPVSSFWVAEGSFAAVRPDMVKAPQPQIVVSDVYLVISEQKDITDVWLVMSVASYPNKKTSPSWGW